MESKNSYQVSIRQKIPYFTKFITVLTCIAFLFLGVFYLYFAPVDNQTPENQALYFSAFTPDLIKNGLILTSISLVILLPLLFIRKFKHATLTFLPNEIHLTDSEATTKYSINQFRNVFVADPMTRSGFPKQKLTIFFQLKADYTICVRLIDYMQSSALFEDLTQYKDLEVLFSESSLPFPNEQ